MIFAKENGRLQLLDRMHQMLPIGQEFTLAQAVVVFEDSFANDRIEDITDGLMFVGWPIGPIGKRYFDIALCRQLGWENEVWEEPPGQIVAQFKIPCGLPSLFLSRQLFPIEASQREETTRFFTSIRNTRMYRWYGVRKPMESKLTLWGGDEFFDMASTILPILQEAGLLNCDGCCTVEQSIHGGEQRNAPKSRCMVLPKWNVTSRNLVNPDVRPNEW
ncbi:hypothetical protein [Aureliella helgolandensis]|nr:hypothetical protein [Aureliella helgolandensis]